MASITIPIVLDANASATIFAEAAPSTDISYAFTMSSSSLTAAKMSSFLRYIDQDDGNTLFTYSSTAKDQVSNGLHADISNVNVVHAANNFPNHNALCANATLGEMLVKYIASVLFGHPEAQAPIKNDDDIIHAVQTTSDLHGQFVTDLTAGLTADATNAEGGASNAVVQSIFEQLVTYSSTTDASASANPDDNRFGDTSHTSGSYLNIPFRTGDTIIFLISMGGSLTNDSVDAVSAPFTSNTAPTMASLFGSNPELTGANKDQLVTKIWQLSITLA